MRFPCFLPCELLPKSPIFPIIDGMALVAISVEFLIQVLCARTLKSVSNILPSISACLITRNEEKFLSDCLQSLSGHVNEIVIVDTGSEDNTVAIAEKFGCQVLHHTWDADFSTPRNLGLDHAQNDWILYIDADERLSTTKDCLGDLLPNTGAAALRVKFYPRVNSTPYAESRIFRNDPRIRFTGKMHESMRSGISQVCREEGISVVDGFNIVLTHLGYEGDQSAKNSRNIPLLEQAILDVSDRVYLRFHLGVTLDAIGDQHQATSQLIKGIELAEHSNASPQGRTE